MSLAELAAPAASSLPPEALRRIAITSSCRDCDALPKVPDAGQTFSAEDRRYQLMHNGVRVLADGYCGPWMSELIRRLRGHHEPQEELAFHHVLEHVHPGGAMVELGSYWAYYSLWFQRRVPRARTYLIEPDPNNLQVGRVNFALNGARGEFFQYSVGRRSHEPAPFLCGDSDRVSRMVPQTSVDDFLAQVGLDRVELLLADIQGAELEMLHGARRAIEQGQLRFVFVSTHHHSISGDPLTHQRCLRFLKEHGAHLLADHSVSESFSGDGLIVASFAEEDRGLPPISLSCNRAANSLFRELEYDLAEAWQFGPQRPPRGLRRYWQRLKRAISRLVNHEKVPGVRQF